MKKILLVTERRADYSRFKEILKEINNEDTLKYVLIVTGIHLEKSFGKTINEKIITPSLEDMYPFISEKKKSEILKKLNK